jgi:hypothetical protein
MMPNNNDRNWMAEAHRQDLLREAEHERLLAQLPRPDHSGLLRFMAIPALFLGEIRKRLQQQAKQRMQQVTHRAAR